MNAAVSHIDDYVCQVCRKTLLKLVDGFELLPRVTSDCRPFLPGGQLAVCMHCAAVQKLPTTQWLDEINHIYADYQAYRLADGEEQLVVDPLTGQPKKRSLVIMGQLSSGYDFPASARVIDIGCGDGVTLKAMSAFFPAWQLNGYELNSEKIEKLQKLTGFKKLYVGDLSGIDQQFDVVTMVHSLEHFVEPLNTLKNIRHLMSENGKLFVEVCNIDENPFDLLVADHLMHFSPQSVTNIAKQAGFQCMSANTDWVKKEISYVGLTAQDMLPIEPVDAALVYARIKSYVAWLTQLITDATQAASAQKTFGIFGTSIAASWLVTELGDRVKFFVDEDPYRVGRQYMGRPVYGPDQVPSGAAVYLALAPVLSLEISQRLQNNAWSFVGMPVR